MKDPTLAFIGYVRPVLGSLITITEIQSFFVSRVFSGRCRLPLPDERQKEALNDKLFWEDYFKDTSRRLSTLVEAYTYGDDIGKKCGITPDYWALFKRNPRAAIMAVFAPYNGSSLRLSDTKYQEKALQQLRNQSSGTFSPLHLLLISFLRLIWFDFWLDILGEVKYRIQCARWWRKIRDSSPIRFLDFVWQTPKRLLFDNTTRAWRSVSVGTPLKLSQTPNGITEISTRFLNIQKGSNYVSSLPWSSSQWNYVITTMRT